MKKQLIIYSFGLLLASGLSAQTPTPVRFEANPQGVLSTVEVSATLAAQTPSLTRNDAILPTLDSNVIVIEDTAFKDTKGYATITIPHNVRKIGKLVFAKCNDLTTIYFKQSVPVTPPPTCQDTILDTLRIDGTELPYSYRGKFVTDSGDFEFFFPTLSPEDSCDLTVYLHVIVSGEVIVLPPVDAGLTVYFERVIALTNRTNDPYLKAATHKWYKDGEVLFGETKNYVDAGKPIPAGTYKVIATYDSLGTSKTLERDSTFVAVAPPAKLSPNPVNIDEPLNILTGNKKAIIRHEVYDLSGQKEAVILRGNVGKYQLHGFKKRGTYIVTLYFEDGEVEVNKIVIK